MTGKEKIFNEIKGNCADRMDIGGIDHCVFHEDDCGASCCPHMKKYNDTHPVIRDEAQCPTCGSIVSAYKIDKTPLTFLQGLFCGALAVIAAITLFWGLYELIKY